MIAYIALALSILNTLFWILFIAGLRGLYKRFAPTLKYLTPPSVSASVSGSDEVVNPFEPH